jgi:uncharacterized protein (DUF305 family)
VENDEIEDITMQVGSAASLRVGAITSSESETDRALAESLIAHYQEAITYAERVLACSSDAYLCWLADAAAETHRRDIASLRDWMAQQKTGF